MAKPIVIKADPPTYQAGEIIVGQSGKVIDFSALMNDLSKVQIIYVGERHPDVAHHEIQLKILSALEDSQGPVTVGMEMFDHSYQNVLDRWSKGELDQTAFLKLTHWYANWRFDYELYQPILAFVKKRQLPLIGLNLPFHIPPKIATGGLDSLGPEDKKHLPEKIDTTNTEHKHYLENIFAHHQVKGREDFNAFYEAQCTWEDAMADTLSKHLGRRKMVVIAGNGHIIKKFGIPKRAFQRTQAPYRTIYLAAADSKIDLTYGDYIWVTAKSEGLRSMGMQ